MARAEIYIEDAEEGEGLDARFVFIGGFDQNADAHQMVNLVRAYLDQVMVVREETPLETTSVRPPPVAVEVASTSEISQVLQ